MRILESAPRRYDLGIRLLSLGRVGEMYEQVAARAVGNQPSPVILEIGCGTGNLTRALVQRGARVTAIDMNPDMMELARAKLDKESGAPVEFLEMAAVEIADRFPPARFDAAVASLVLSEMSEDEQTYVLEAVRQVLHPEGRLVIADEVQSAGRFRRLAQAAMRLPVAALTYAITQTSTTAVRDLDSRVEAAGFRLCEQERLTAGVGVVVAEKPPEDS
jgi:demethylmenaquinone methyltransferase/2-methoxy-6-polyprenyl-1,4-benzoquinol methylase